MSRKALFILITVALAALLAVPMMAQDDVVTITWFIGLGTGSQPDQLDAQQAVVDAFNESHDNIQLETIIVNNTGTAPIDALNTLIGSGETPDIVGPVGVNGSNSFVGQYADLAPLIEAVDYDLSDFDPAQVDFYRDPVEGLLGLPFAVYPSFIYYNIDLFEEAGLEEPPHEYGAPYMLDGEEVEWNIDTLSEVAKILTVDANGNDATMEEFDPEAIEQWGFYQQWTDFRGRATLFGANNFVAEDGSAVIPENWREFAHWYYDAMWKYHFVPTDAQAQSDMLNAGNVFPSGRVAMSLVHLWYLASAGDGNWDFAATPSYNGTITAKLHADTFRMMKDSENKAEAFEVIAYLTGEAAPELLLVYGGMPSRISQQESYIATLEEQYPGRDWNVAIESLSYPDNPNHEAYLPGFNLARDRVNQFDTLYQGTAGLDIDAELDNLQADLQAIFDGTYEPPAAEEEEASE